MKTYRLHIKSIFTIYLFWSVILASYGTWNVLTSGYGEKVGDETFRYFLSMYYAGFLIFFVLGAFLAWYTQQGKSWALWIFTVYCLYRSIDTIFGIKAREGMEHATVDMSDWIRSTIIAVVWASLIGLAWYIRPNKSLNLTAQKMRRQVSSNVEPVEKRTNPLQ